MGTQALCVRINAHVCAGTMCCALARHPICLMLCMYVLVCMHTNKAYTHFHSCKAMHVVCIFGDMNKVCVWQGDTCICARVYMSKVYADCCEAMHACVGVCVSAYTRRMINVIAVRQCMRNHATCIGMHNGDLANGHMHT